MLFTRNMCKLPEGNIFKNTKPSAIITIAETIIKIPTAEILTITRNSL